VDVWLAEGEALRKGPEVGRVSVVATVRDEGENLHRLLDSLAVQSRPPDEIIICDGGSSDDTLTILGGHARRKELPLKVIVRPGTNISQGRNAAIAEAKGAVIAVTDAGVRLAPEWLASLIAPFEENPQTHVVSGFFAPDPQSVFEIALSATTLPVLAEVDPLKFLPSSRSVAFRREAWEGVGGYPEWIDYCEDVLFDFALREQYGSFAFAPQAVAHFRPRINLTAFFRQYYRYGRGDGKANLWPKRHAVRYVTYLGVAPLLILLGLFYTPLWLLALLIGGTVMFRTPCKRLFRMVSLPQAPPLSLWEQVQAIIWVPVIRLAGDVAKMIGYPAGRWWRWEHHQQIPAHYPRR
jgi:glycosyltransferase involved in cell wall biosynthesis